MTVFVAIVFFIFGLSADGKLRKLPFLKLGIFLIAGIYVFRGIGELIFDISQQESETVYSLIALGIGLLFLIGGLKKWKSKKGIKNAQHTI